MRNIFDQAGTQGQIDSQGNPLLATPPDAEPSRIETKPFNQAPNLETRQGERERASDGKGYVYTLHRQETTPFDDLTPDRPGKNVTEKIPLEQRRQPSEVAGKEEYAPERELSLEEIVDRIKPFRQQPGNNQNPNENPMKLGRRGMNIVANYESKTGKTGIQSDPNAMRSNPDKGTASQPLIKPEIQKPKDLITKQELDDKYGSDVKSPFYDQDKKDLFIKQYGREVNPNHGWKLHIAVPEENRMEIDAALQKSGLHFKNGRSDQEGKDFTIYAGSRDHANAIAK